MVCVRGSQMWCPVELGKFSVFVSLWIHRAQMQASIIKFFACLTPRCPVDGSSSTPAHALLNHKIAQRNIVACNIEKLLSPCPSPSCPSHPETPMLKSSPGHSMDSSTPIHNSLTKRNIAAIKCLPTWKHTSGGRTWRH